MTIYTVADFKNAWFAHHPRTEDIAMRAKNSPFPWRVSSGPNSSDAGMAHDGWVPVPAGSYTRTDDDGLTLLMVQQQRDQATARAEKAEQERGEWEKIALTAERDADEAEENPRPLTADDITEDMIERGVHEFNTSPFENSSREDVLGILRAALTPPPSRPEGAEEIEVLLFDAGVDENRAEVANYLAARLTDPTSKEG